MEHKFPGKVLSIHAESHQQVSKYLHVAWPVVPMQTNLLKFPRGIKIEQDGWPGVFHVKPSDPLEASAVAKVVPKCIATDVSVGELSQSPFQQAVTPTYELRGAIVGRIVHDDFRFVCSSNVSLSAVVRNQSVCNA